MNVDFFKSLRPEIQQSIRDLHAAKIKIDPVCVKFCGAHIEVRVPDHNNPYIRDDYLTNNIVDAIIRHTSLRVLGTDTDTERIHLGL